MQNYEIPNNADQANTINNNQLQKSFLTTSQVGNKTVVTENTQFKKELQLDIEEHFVFMLRASFFSGVFEEITIFIDKYEAQYKISLKLFDDWKSIDELMEKTQRNIVWAENQITLIEEYKKSGVTHQQYNDDQRNVWLAMLDKDFMMIAAVDNAFKQGERARVEAEANTTLKEAQFHLDWLQVQQEKRQKFQIQLDQISQNWQSDHEIYSNGKEFINKVNDSQIELFKQKTWNSGPLGLQLQEQREIANPYFNKLYQQYLVCYKFYLDLNELFELVKNKKEIKEIIIEIAWREAFKPTVDAFIKNLQDQWIDADHKLQNLANGDILKQLRKFARNAHQSLQTIGRGYQGLYLNVSKEEQVLRNSTGQQIGRFQIINHVNLEKVDLNLIHVDPDEIQYSQQTIQQQQIVRGIEHNLEIWRNVLVQLQNCKQKLEELQAQPPLIRQKYAQMYEQESLGGQTLVLQFKELLELSLKEDYNTLFFNKDRRLCLIGALSERLIIKQNVLCLCCSRQNMQQSDHIFYEDYEKSIAAEVRRLTNSENKWFTSASKRILSADKLPAVKTTSNLMLNNNILAALRNNDGQRQMARGARKFDVTESIAYTINELCQLIVVEEKQGQI